ncbi:MAG: hypothetical protein IJ309_06830 [Clostridia bacterium]|nr:hypothetical protein [Clostridia bacterium]
MKKSFVYTSLIMVTSTALLSVIFSILYYFADNYIVDPVWVKTVAYYAKRVFDLFAVFTGYAIIIYAYARYKAMDAIYSIGIFGISVFISLLYQVIGVCVSEQLTDVNNVLTTIYLSIGSCIVSQLLPALLVAFLTYKLTKDGARRISSFISWKNPIHRCMIITTLSVFGVNIISHLGFNILPFLITNNFYIYESDFWSIMGSLLEYVIFYILLQYCVYILGYIICYKFGEKETTEK